MSEDGTQPPSGGCVLKLAVAAMAAIMAAPAAFGRLCVETGISDLQDDFQHPAAFGRLCVETTLLQCRMLTARNQPPSGGCVLKPKT